MRKLYITLCFVLLFSGCKPNESNSSDPSSKLTFNILGKYICSGDYFNSEFFIENPECIPSVTFYDDGNCILFVNYSEGGCNVGGFYTVENNYIKVTLNLNNTIFEEDGVKYMDDLYVFNIKSNDQIIIDRSYYGVEAGDAFIKKG